MTRRRAAAALLLLAVAAACSDTGADDADAPVDDIAHPLRLDEIQVLGTHNSYRAAMTPELLDLVTQFDEASGQSLDYAHPPLRTQLEELGARQLELDVYADPDGGLYADRRALELLDRPIASGEPALDEPGFKVLHSADLDFNSTCLTFVACLGEIDAWSDDHPRHLPVLLLVEAKSTPTPDPARLGFVDPPDFDEATLAALDAEVRSVFDDDELLTPADKPAPETWPALDDVRGTVLFALDNDDLHPIYGGNVFFTNRTGFSKLNDPIADAGAIADRLRDHHLVRTRADADTLQARANDTARRDAALASGAQWISTDYLVADERFSDYSVRLPGGVIARCNPVVAPDCDVDQLRE